MKNIKLIKYSTVEKTADGFAPKLHKAIFFANGNLVEASFDGDKLTVPVGLNDQEKEAIHNRMVIDWDTKALMLERTKEGFKASGVDPKIFMSKQESA